MTGQKETPWKKAIVEVLEKSGVPMTRTEIAQAIVETGLRKNVGATPANTVVAYISQSLKNDGEKTPFVRVGRGEYALCSITDKQRPSAGSSEEGSETSNDGVRAFGVYWSRDFVHWKNKPALMGQEQLGATPVNMSGQIGIYVLLDGRDAIYVGRSIDRPLGQRLLEHTRDRLRARWNRFSWFGLYGVTDKKELKAESSTLTHEGLVRTLEAVLIESMEPGQNRRRGDDFSGIEYIQVPDPNIEKQRKLAVLKDLGELVTGNS